MPDDNRRLCWGIDALWQQLLALLPGLSVEVVARIGSTNTELLERARRASPGAGGRRQTDVSPCLLVAEHQTQGRGRQGKDWQSSAGASLTFSLALPLAPDDWSGLSLAVGLALVDALDPPRPGQPLRLGLKWPNDLLIVAPAAAAGAPAIGRKLGGILIETVQLGARRMAVIGIGLNLQAQATPELSWGFGCLQELHADLTAPAALACVAPALVRALLAFEREGFAPLQQRYAQRDLLRGRRVSTTLPGVPFGLADGVDQTGTLWLRVTDDVAAGEAERRVPVSSGEVSLRLANDCGAAVGPLALALRAGTDLPVAAGTACPLLPLPAAEDPPAAASGPPTPTPIPIPTPTPTPTPTPGPTGC
jgi:BirA family biotin operon repressor/biotin-[acetyl-CoA-carboxylase] ligase